jgi:hypothetical protein
MEAGNVLRFDSRREVKKENLAEFYRNSRQFSFSVQNFITDGSGKKKVPIPCLSFI